MLSANCLWYCRWQTNGAYAIGEDGKITYTHVGKDSGDMADLEQAIKSVS